jgi:hypothetical protein
MGRPVVVGPESVGYKGEPASRAALRRISIRMLGIAAKFGRPGKAQQVVVELSWSENFGGVRKIAEGNEKGHDSGKLPHG